MNNSWIGSLNLTWPKQSWFSSFIYTPSLAQENYRADINALRAISVLLVIFYHIFGKYGFFPQGFYGVDVFFVISGYLITSHLVSELKSGVFSLRKFYLRRMNRIFPVFLFTLFCVCFIGFFVLTPNDLKTLLETALSASLSVSNLYFWKHISFGYFATDSNVLPLLHTWSLGVEEQFYFVWPLILWLGFSRGPRALGLMTLLIIAASLVTYFTLHTNLNLVFYSPMTRAFELLSGGCLAIYWEKLKAPPSKIAFILSSIGLFLIIYLSSYMSEIRSVAIGKVIICFATTLLIYSGKTKNTLIYKALSFNMLTFLGLISYSLYLWHWPIIAYMNYFGLEMNEQIGVLIFVTSLVFSSLSWKYIEEPFRRKYKFGLKKAVILFLITPSLLLSILVLACHLTPNLGFNTISPTVFETIGNSHGPYAGKNCMDAPTLYPESVEQCSLGDSNNKNPDVLIVGDSHAMALAGMLDVFLKESHLHGYLITQSGSPFLLGNIKNWRDREDNQQRNDPIERSAVISKMIKENHYSFVVLGGYWNYYSDAIFAKKRANTKNYSMLEKGLSEAIECILSAGSIPVLALDVPPLGKTPLTCGFTRLNVGHCYHSEDGLKKIQKNTRKLIARLEKKYPLMRVIDPYDAICKQGRCFSSLNNQPLYYSNGDNSHLNYIGSTVIGTNYLQEFVNPFA